MEVQVEAAVGEQSQIKVEEQESQDKVIMEVQEVGRIHLNKEVQEVEAEPVVDLTTLREPMEVMELVLLHFVS
jgi:hypothetical protein